MLGIVVTAYNPYYFNYHNILLKDLNKKEYKPIFVTTWEHEDFIATLADNINYPLYQLTPNPGKHDGTFYLVTSTKPHFEECDYILHYHADNWFKDGSKIISDTYEYVKKHDIKVAGLPRHWLLNDDLTTTGDKTIPFHFDFCMMKSELFNNIFDEHKLEEYKDLSEENGHPSREWEPCMYHALEMNGVDIDKEIYYVDSVEKLRKEFGDIPAYYNFFCPDSGIFHYDEKALMNGGSHRDAVHWVWKDEEGKIIRKFTQEEMDNPEIREKFMNKHKKKLD